MFWCLLGLWLYGAYDTYEIQRGILLDNVDDIQTNQKLFLLFYYLAPWRNLESLSFLLCIFLVFNKCLSNNME